MHQLKIVSGNSKELTPSVNLLAMRGRHLLSVHDFSTANIESVLSLARDVKANPFGYVNALQHRAIALISEKPGLHTRVTFDLAMRQLGGGALTLDLDDLQLGARDATKDTARNLSSWLNGIVVRLHSHQALLELSQNATIPVINGLSDFEHPCQALADYMTLIETGARMEGLTIAWVGDGNNVAHSLIYGAARVGARMRVATPPGYEPDRSVIAEARREGGEISLTHDPSEAIDGASVVYTDVWTSIGKEDEAEMRQEIFRPFQIDSQLMELAAPNAFFMHCQPARRGEEVTDEVLDGPRSLVYRQAENRLHLQKALFLALLS